MLIIITVAYSSEETNSLPRNGNLVDLNNDVIEGPGENLLKTFSLFCQIIAQKEFIEHFETIT